MADSAALAELSKFPNVHAAYEVYMNYFDEPPSNATHLVKWCKKQGITDISYANVNKYLRIKRQQSRGQSTEKKKKAYDIHYSLHCCVPLVFACAVLCCVCMEEYIQCVCGIARIHNIHTHTQTHTQMIQFQCGEGFI